jgi:hypothetical protein
VGLRQPHHRTQLAALTIVSLLVLAPRGRSIVPPATRIGLLPTMVCPTTEGTTKIPPTGIPRMRQKPDPALAAVRNALAKMRMGRQHRVECHLILLNKRLDAILLVPPLAK